MRHHRDGSTPIDFKGTELMPLAKGNAKVDSKMGSTKVETRLEKMTPASQFGTPGSRVITGMGTTSATAAMSTA